jgi:hypothetical protein
MVSIQSISVKDSYERCILSCPDGKRYMISSINGMVHSVKKIPQPIPVVMGLSDVSIQPTRSSSDPPLAPTKHQVFEFPDPLDSGLTIVIEDDQYGNLTAFSYENNVIVEEKEIACFQELPFPSS